MSRSMIYSLALGALAAVVSATPASAQVPFLIEGNANAIASDGAGGVNVTVGGAVLDLKVAPNAPVVTGLGTGPTYANLLNPAPFPGRTQSGFVGSVVKASGATSALGVVTVGSIDIRPGIASIAGVITANTLGTVGGSISVNGTPCILNTDARLPLGVLMNDLGLPIAPAAAIPGTSALVIGYPANNGTSSFYCTSIEAIGIATNAVGLNIGIERVASPGGVINVRGGISGLPLTLARTAVVNVSIFAPGATPLAPPVLLGTVATTPGVLAGTRIFTFKTAKALAVVPTTIFAQVSFGVPAVTVKSAVAPVQ
ncbi:MAG: hypothetical protein WCJ31_11240 [Planctomycetia bacterium]